MESFAKIRQTLFEQQINLSEEAGNCEGCVMIIDDNLDIIKALTSLLKPYFRVYSYVSYEEAKDKLSPEIRVILLDIKMASKDGIDAFKLLKEEREDLQIIFHSAYPGTSQRAAAVDELDHIGYLTKGEYNLPELLTLIKRALN